MREGILKKYEQFLPVTENTPRISLGEGDTPLVYLDRLSALLEVRLYAKLEGLNPTGSFKDRGMVLAVAKAKEAGAKTVICASTGNTSASAAAYAAHAGMRAVVVIPEGKVAVGKLAQALLYGAEIIQITGNFDQGLALVRKLADGEGMVLVNSVNPYRLEGQKTGAFEIIESLGRAPDVLAIPVGNAGNISAYWQGFVEAVPEGAKRPKMFGFEAEGAAAIVRGEPILHPETVASAIRIGNPASWEKAVHAARDSGGRIAAVSDAEILEAYRKLALMEGVFVEPASAAAVAGLFKAKSEGWLTSNITVVAVLTGNGLKDPDMAMKEVHAELATLPPEEESIRSYLLKRGAV
ncbi:MAG: Threonine synthase [Candidatus Carbobacillus altaicus]|uniref:Threonine synthase n=1 Tax=Candidatus Carbonibacillus altaicus TaxID=2163959 RepID=A0A2R6Y577_9BACL|nr:MAG: Threonine synthase [Candidatus Carbobacillus altaicus]